MGDTRRTLNGLPVPLTSFVGRGPEITEVRRLLGVGRLVTLTGVGGVGKTRLARETAAASVRAFSDGVFLVALAEVSDPVSVPGVVSTALGLVDQGTRAVSEQLTDYLSRRQLLLVLDNCEHLIDACAELAQRLLENAPDLRVLATSREPLALTGEHVFPVPALDEAAAVELLRDRAAAVRPGFQVTGENRPEVGRLCADLDGLPLAIELAASRLRTLSVTQAVERLEDRFALLTTGSRVAPPQQRTLRAAVNWSWDLCTPEEQSLWARLAVFTGSFTLDAVEHVCTGGPVAASDVLDLLDRLVSQSLVEATQHAGTHRYRMLETIRQYGWERLADSGEEQSLRLRHRHFCLRLARRLVQDWLGPRQSEILARLRAEHSNLLAALDHGHMDVVPGREPQDAAGDNYAQDTLELAAALVFHWTAGGFLSDGRRHLERALARAPEPTPARASALLVAVHVAQCQSDLTAADEWLAEADELAEKLGAPLLGADVRGHRGVSALFRGRTDQACSLLEEAVAAHSALGDRYGTVSWLNALAIARYVAGEPRASETGRKALAALETCGDRWGRAYLLMTMSRHSWTLGKLPEAEALALSALELGRGLGDIAGVAKMVEQLAWIKASAGDHRRAASFLGVAQSLRYSVGISVDTGDPRRAEYHEHCVTEVRRALGVDGYEQVLREVAALGDAAEAIDHALRTDAAPPVARNTAHGSPLTRREQQVAALVAQGMTNRRIAAELVLSPRTVDSHVDHILTKLGFSSRAQVAAWCAANR
jgi:predicted ATPase/DNA-binding CsgD family transcriptional regulator